MRGMFKKRVKFVRGVEIAQYTGKFMKGYRLYKLAMFKITMPVFDYMMMSINGDISVLLAFCTGNSPVTGEFPSQRPV